MANSTKKFPAFFPKGCPPQQAVDDKRLLYRICKSSVISENDFLSFYEINSEKFKDNIQAYGLSVFPSIEDCENAKEKSPKLRKRKGIACGWTDHTKGKTLDTPNSNNPHHITWWLYDGVKPHTFFTACSEGGVKDE